MPIASLNGNELHYEIAGTSGPWLTLSHALACDLSQWDAQTEALAGQFRILRYDLPGHGGSGVPTRPLSFPQLAADVVALWDHLGIARSHFVGLSLGGMVGQHLALAAGCRVERLVLCSTASSHAANRDTLVRLWQQRIAQAEAGGMAAVAEATLERWFTEPYRLEFKDAVAAVRRAILATPVAGYAAAGRLVPDLNIAAQLGRIAAPTLVLAGDEDPGTPPALAEAIAAAIPGARLEVLPQASHLLNIEQAELFNALLAAFLDPTP